MRGKSNCFLNHGLPPGEQLPLLFGKFETHVVFENIAFVGELWMALCESFLNSVNHLNYYQLGCYLVIVQYNKNIRRSMAEAQLEELKIKYAEFQSEFENYKVECKQLEAFLEEQLEQKEQEIKALKEQSIRKEKVFSLNRLELGQAQAENKNLRGRIEEMEAQVATLKQKPIQKQVKDSSIELQTLKKAIQDLTTQLQKCEHQKNKALIRISQLTKTHSAKLEELHDEINKKNQTMERLNNQIEELKNIPTMKQPLGKSVQITIQRTKRVPVQDQSEQMTKIKKMYEVKVNELAASSDRVKALTNKIRNCQQRIEQLQYEVSTQELKQLKGSFHGTPNPKQSHLFNMQNSESEEQKSPSKHKQKGTISALIVTKTYYNSPFLQIQAKSTISLFKTDKNSRVEKSLGSLKYRLNKITHDPDQLTTKTADSITHDIRSGVNARVVVYGVRRTGKRNIMMAIIHKIRSQISKIVEQGQNFSMVYAEYLDQFVKVRYEECSRPEQMQGLLERIACNQLQQKSPRKAENLVPEQKVCQFRLKYGDKFIEIITSSFVNVEIKQDAGLDAALSVVAYSKLPKFDHEERPHLQIILTLNPILGLYQQTKSTLSLVNCKNRGQHPSVFRWRESPTRNSLNETFNSKASVPNAENEPEGPKAKKLSQAVRYYRNKLLDLQAQLKILLNVNAQNSYLRKSPAVASYEKMLRFIQSSLGYETQSNSPARDT